MRQIRLGSYKPSPDEIKAINEVLQSGQISPGPKCKEFEERFADFHGAKYGVFVNSGTDALRCSLAALKEQYRWRPDAEVLVPATTFVATINVVLQNGLLPRLMDNGLEGTNVDRLNHFDFYYPDRPEPTMPDIRKIKGWRKMGKINFEKPGTGIPKTVKAIVPVHLCGIRQDPAQLLELACRRNWKIIEDSCESMGVGPLFGDVACYSTYVCHIMTTGVGGIAITNDRTTAGLIRSFANHGRDITGMPGQDQRPISARFKYDRIGYSARPTEFQAALGLEQLKHLEENLEKRRTIAWTLSDRLVDFWDQIRVPTIYDNNACMMYPVLALGKTNRDKLCAFLEKNGIETRPLMPVLNQPCYQGAPWLKGHHPEALEYLKRGFYIPCHQDMNLRDVRHIVDTFGRALDKKRK